MSTVLSYDRYEAALERVATFGITGTGGELDDSPPPKYGWISYDSVTGEPTETGTELVNKLSAAGQTPI